MSVGLAALISSGLIQLRARQDLGAGGGSGEGLLAGVERGEEPHTIDQRCNRYMVPRDRLGLSGFGVFLARDSEGRTRGVDGR